MRWLSVPVAEAGEGPGSVGSPSPPVTHGAPERSAYRFVHGKCKTDGLVNDSSTRT